MIVYADCRVLTTLRLFAIEHTVVIMIDELLARGNARKV